MTITHTHIHQTHFTKAPLLKWGSDRQEFWLSILLLCLLCCPSSGHFAAHLPHWYRPSVQPCVPNFSFSFICKPFPFLIVYVVLRILFALSTFFSQILGLFLIFLLFFSYTTTTAMNCLKRFAGKFTFIFALRSCYEERKRRGKRGKSVGSCHDAFLSRSPLACGQLLSQVDWNLWMKLGKPKNRGEAIHCTHLCPVRGWSTTQIASKWSDSDQSIKRLHEIKECRFRSTARMNEISVKLSFRAVSRLPSAILLLNTTDKCRIGSESNDSWLSCCKSDGFFRLKKSF